MKKTILFFTLISFFLMNAQTAPNIEWQKSFGGSKIDYAGSIQQTTDGGYIVAGISQSNDGDVSGNHGDSDYWIVKLGNSGIIQWQKSLGGSNVDIVSSIQQTADSGYIIAGYSYSNDNDVSGNHSGNGADYWIVKLDNSGIMQWQKMLGGTNTEDARSIQQTADGGYIIAGSSASNDGDVSSEHHGNFINFDYWIVKLNSIGNIQWQKLLGGSSTDNAHSVRQTSDGGYIVAGMSQSIDGDINGHHGTANTNDCWVVKLDSIGNIQWQKSLGGNDEERPSSIQQTVDGGYIVAGYSKSNDGDVSGNHGDYDSWIVKLDSYGNMQWQKSLGGSSNDSSASIQQTVDGGYIIAGYSYSNDGDVSGNHGNFDAWIVKLDAYGNMQWQKSLGGSNADFVSSIQQTTDGGYIIAGYSSSTDGDVSGNHGNNDYWIVKLSPDGLATQEIQRIKTEIYPNPVKDILYFSEEVSNVKITDVSGRMVKQFSTSGKSINIVNLTKGIYIITATTKSGETVFKKFIKE